MHEEDEIVVDWVVQGETTGGESSTFKTEEGRIEKLDQGRINIIIPGYKVSLPMVARFHLARDAGGVERVCWVEERWRGVPNLNADTVFPSLLGSFYSGCRRAVGFTVASVLSLTGY